MQMRSDAGPLPPAYEVTMMRLLPPRPMPGAIRRERLLARIRESEAPIVLIQGPAGYGKSTLMQQAKSAYEQSKVCTGWLTLHDADNDLSRLNRLLHALLSQLSGEDDFARRGAMMDRALRDRAHRVDWLLERLVALNQPLVLFVDEFQNLASNAALAFFRDFLAYLPKNVRIVIGSRTMPEVGLARLAVMGQVEVVRPAELTFTRDEVEAFFSSSDMELGSDKIDAIFTRTEGWPAAVQLYRLSLSHAEPRQSLVDLQSAQPRQLTEYLADNVLSLYPHDVQTFFLETSLLARLCGPLCDVITGRDNSRELLAKLEESGLFVRSLDSSLQWFQYPSLLSGFLKAQMHQQAPEREREIHVQAARWFRDNGFFEEAMAHALAAGDHAFAAACLETWSTQLVLEGNLATVEKWFEQLPLIEVQRHPRLLVKVAWALAFMRRHRKLDEVLGLLDRCKPADEAFDEQAVVRSMVCTLKDDIPGAKRYAEHLDDTKHPASDVFSIFEAGATAILKGHLAIFAGDLELGREYLVRGRAYGRQVDSSFTVLGAIATSALNLAVQGRLAEALEQLSDVPSEASLSLDHSISSAAYAAAFIHALYESNQLEAAHKLFERAYPAIAGGAQVDFMIVACIAMIRTFDATDRVGRANALIEDMEAIGHAGNLPRLLRRLAWERVRRALLAGDLERARAIANRIPLDHELVPEGWIPFSEDAEDALISRIRLAIHEGAAEQALQMLAPELEQAARQGRVRRRIKLLLLEAIARGRAGAEAGTCDGLQEALRLARQGRYVRVFLDEGRLALDALATFVRSHAALRAEAISQFQPEMDFARQLLSSAGVPDADLPESAKAIIADSLSSREEEILTLLVQGMSNRELGERLFISENTVKFHLKSIYAKLGVKNRSQAISLAGPLRTT